MNILIINGSHRHGNTDRFVQVAKEALEKQRHNVEILELLENRFDFCNGCLICEETGECVINDLFSNRVYPALKAADAYVFAMPVYFNNVPALFKNFIDRTNCLCGYFEETPKKAAVFLVGQLDAEEGSSTSVLNYLKEYAEIMNFDLCDNNICVTAREADALEISEEMEGIVSRWF